MRWFHTQINVLLLSIWLWIAPCFAIMNITVDDSDPSIEYVPAPGWAHELSVTTFDRSGGTTSFTFVQGARATLRFRGSAIYFVSYGLLPNEARSNNPIFQVDLDGLAETRTLGVSTFEDKAMYMAYGRTGLDPTLEHQITVSNPFALPFNVDAFVITVDDDSQGSPTQPNVGGTSLLGPNTTATPLPSASDRPQSAAGLSTIAAIMAGVLGGLFLAICAGLAIFWFRRQKPLKTESKEGKSEAGIVPSDSDDGKPTNGSLLASEVQPLPPVQVPSRMPFRSRSTNWDVVSPYYPDNLSSTSQSPSVTLASAGYRNDPIEVKLPIPERRPLRQYPSAIVTNNRSRERGQERDRGRRAMSMDDNPITRTRDSIVITRLPPPYVG